MLWSQNINDLSNATNNNNKNYDELTVMKITLCSINNSWNRIAETCFDNNNINGRTKYRWI